MGRDLGVALWLAVLLLLGSVAVFLTWRRIAGALVQAPSGGALVVAAIGLVTMAVLLRVAARQRGNLVLSAEYAVLAHWLPGIGAVLLLAALTLPGTPGWSMALAWLMLIAGETASWRIYLNPSRRIAERATNRTFNDEALAAADEPEMPAGLVQRLIRIRDEGREDIYALVQAEIAAGDRLAVVHVAFVPPLAARPALAAHAVDEDDAEVRVTQTETFGARIEVRLSQNALTPRRAMIEVLGSVTCPPGA